MPVKVTGPDGNNYMFPDGTDKAGAVAYFKKKGIGAKAASKTPQRPFLERITEIQPHQAVHSASDLGREIVRGVGNIGAGGLSVLAHPVETVKGMGRLFADPFVEGHPESMKIASSLITQPAETVESATGQSAVMGGLGELGEAGLKGIGRTLTKTGPKVAGELAKTVGKGNEAATTKAAEDTAKQAEKHAKDVETAKGKRKAEVGKYFQKTQEAKAARGEHRGVLGEEHELTPTEKVSRKGAIERGVERLDTEVRGDLTKLEEKVNAEGNKKYNELKKVLKNEKADRFQAVDEQGQPIGQPKNITEHLDDVAHASLRGTESETPIMKSLSKRVENDEIDLTYDDLQGYREEIGKELRKGTLIADVYTSYKNLMGAIDDAMDKIAAKKGLKPLQDAARAYWRQYADTFLDSDSPFRKWKTAADSPNYKPGMGASFIKNADTGIQAIAKYDPQVAQRLNSLRGYQAEAKALPSKTGKLTSLPKLEPKPPVPEGATAESFAKPVEGNLPPVPKGYVRLYRAESPTVGARDIFDLDKLNKLRGTSPRAPGGRSWTSDPSVADYYRQSYGPSAKTYYADVPESVAKGFQSAEDPTEYVLRGPPPVEPILKKIGPEDIRAAKADSLQNRGVSRLRKVGHGMVTAAVGLPALFRAFHGNFAGIPGDLMEAGAGYAATETFARLLENKAIQRILTNPTPADVAQIPPEMRANLTPILDAAKARGIKVSQALYPIGAATQKKTVGGLRKTAP